MGRSGSCPISLRSTSVDRRQPFARTSRWALSIFQMTNNRAVGVERAGQDSWPLLSAWRLGIPGHGDPSSFRLAPLRGWTYPRNLCICRSVRGGGAPIVRGNSGVICSAAEFTCVLQLLTATSLPRKVRKTILYDWLLYTTGY